MIRYRQAVLEDSAALAELRSRFLVESGETKEGDQVSLRKSSLIFFAEYLHSRDFTAIVAEESGNIIATGGISYFRKPPSSKCPSGIVAYIMNVYTVPLWRKQGVASKVFSMLCEDAKEKGSNQIILNATEMGRPIYEKYGFSDSTGDMILYIE